jgi:hypothetical protein
MGRPLEYGLPLQHSTRVDERLVDHLPYRSATRIQRARWLAHHAPPMLAITLIYRIRTGTEQNNG